MEPDWSKTNIWMVGSIDDTHEVLGDVTLKGEVLSVGFGD